MVAFRHFLPAVIAAAALTACGGGGGTPATPPAVTGGINNSGIAATPNTVIPLSAWTAGKSVSYDISAVDITTNTYYLSDRTSKAVDVASTNTDTLIAQAKNNFIGSTGNNGTSDPNGEVVLPGVGAYDGDVGKVTLVSTKGTILATIPITSPATGAATGNRTDEGCYDSVDGLVEFSNGAEAGTAQDPDFTTWISTKTNTVVAQFAMTAPQFVNDEGLESCVYDPNTGNFFLNNDGEGPNTEGELDVIPAASVVAGAPTVTKQYGEGMCNPSGIALAPSNGNMAITCDTDPGTKQMTLFTTDSNPSAFVPNYNCGGGDEMWYDPVMNRFYLAARYWTATGISAGDPSNGVPPNSAYTPVVGVFNAANEQWIANIPVGYGVHSVTTDQNGSVWIPQPPTATAAGGIGVYILSR